MRIGDFKGLYSGVDPMDVPIGGAVQQINVSTNEPGRLKVRRGIQPASFTSTATLASGLNTFHRPWAVRSRDGDLFILNGVDQPRRWDGVTAAAELAGLAAPAAAPTVASPTGGAATAGDYTVAYRYLDDTVPDGKASNLSPAVTHTAAANDRFTYSDVDDSSEARAVYKEVYRSAADTPNTLFRRGTLGSTGIVLSSADNGSSRVRFTLNPGHRLLVGNIITVTGHSVGGYNTTHTIEAVADSTVDTSVAYSSDGTGGAWEVTSINDTVSDANLLLLDTDDILTVVLPDGALSAYRYVPPPTDRPYAVWFQDRMWYGSFVRYNAGTVATNGSTTITGTSTAWTAQMVGRYIIISGEPEPLEITARGSATSITVAKAATNTDSGLSYVIVPAPARRRSLEYSEIDEPESVSLTNSVTIQENTGDDDVITGLMPRGSFLFVLTERHKYALSYVRQPRIDANVVLVDSRGCFNQFCWDALDDVIYMMDDNGPYAFNGQSSVALDGPINDLWRGDGDGSQVDLSKSSAFSVAVDRSAGKVYFLVAFTGDSGSFPTRALVFNVKTKTWDAYLYPIGLGGACKAHIDSQARLLFGGEQETVYVADEGTTDIATAAVTGTATAGTSTTLVDSGASFTSAVVGAYVYITEGTGKGQYAKITAQNSTTLTVASWSIDTPDTTSQYLVGAVPWQWRTGRLPLTVAGKMVERRVAISFAPTSGDTSLDVQLLFNHDSSAESMATIQKLGDAVDVQPSHLTDARVYLQSTRSGLGNSTGYEQFNFTGRSHQAMQHDRWLTVNLRGAQGDDEVKISEVEVAGVAGET